MRRSVHEVDAGAEAGDIVVAQDAVQRAVAATGDARTEPEKYRGLPTKAARSDRPERLGACKLRRRNDERRLVTVLGIPLLSATVTCGAAVADRNSPLCVFARSRACAAAPPARSRPPCPQPALAPPPDRTARRAPLRCVSRAHRASPGSARAHAPSGRPRALSPAAAVLRIRSLRPSRASSEVKNMSEGAPGQSAENTTDCSEIPNNTRERSRPTNARPHALHASGGGSGSRSEPARKAAPERPGGSGVAPKTSTTFPTSTSASATGRRCSLSPQAAQRHPRLSAAPSVGLTAGAVPSTLAVCS